MPELEIQPTVRVRFWMDTTDDTEIATLTKGSRDARSVVPGFSVKQPVIVSLFDGIGAFPLAGSRHGFIPFAASEINRECIAVTSAHFPAMQHLGDVLSVDGKALRLEIQARFGNAPVILCGGSPCQGFSVAGIGLGLADPRSGLFGEFIRIARELEPDFVIWENVLGVFSSNEGRDFENVIAAFIGANKPVPLPRDARRTAGVARGRHGVLAWRVLDARYFGVPQRRRRVFAILDTRGERSPEILFEQNRVLGNHPQSGKARTFVAAALTGALGARGRDDNAARGGYVVEHPPIGFSSKDHGQDAGVDIAPTLRSMHGVTANSAGNGHVAIAFSLQDSAGDAALEITPTSRGAGAGGLAVAFDARSGLETGEVTMALQSKAQGYSLNTMPLLAFAQNSREEVRDLGDVAGALTTRADPQNAATLLAFEHTDSMNNGIAISEDIAPSMRVSSGHGSVSVATQSAVRRLTPTECEKLQGFPDGWTHIAGASDSARYQMLGNSIAVPVLEWIFKRLNTALEAQA